jgi:hypothetical protein
VRDHDNLEITDILFAKKRLLNLILSRLKGSLRGPFQLIIQLFPQLSQIISREHLSELEVAICRNRSSVGAIFSFFAIDIASELLIKQRDGERTSVLLVEQHILD